MSLLWTLFLNGWHCLHRGPSGGNNATSSCADTRYCEPGHWGGLSVLRMGSLHIITGLVELWGNRFGKRALLGVMMGMYASVAWFRYRNR